MEEANGYEGAERRAHPRFHMTFPAIEDAKEGRGVDLGVEIVTEKKRIKAVGDVRWFSAEASNRVFVGILLKGMGREDRKI